MLNQNAGALAGLEAPEAPKPVVPNLTPATTPAQPEPQPQPQPAPAPTVDMEAIIAQVRAALAAEGNPEVEALKKRLAAAEEENAEHRRRLDASQLVDHHSKAANESRASSLERYGIVIDEARDPNEVDPVFVQVNGRGYSIKRGRYVEVPREVVSVLTDAVQTATTPVKDASGSPTGRVSVRNARRFPFQSYGLVIDKTGRRVKDAPTEEVIG